MDTLRNELNDLQSAFDLQEVVKRAVKYLIEGGAIVLAILHFYKNK